MKRMAITTSTSGSSKNSLPPGLARTMFRSANPSSAAGRTRRTSWTSSQLPPRVSRCPGPPHRQSLPCSATGREKPVGDTQPEGSSLPAQDEMHLLLFWFPSGLASLISLDPARNAPTIATASLLGNWQRDKDGAIRDSRRSHITNVSRSPFPKHASTKPERTTHSSVARRGSPRRSATPAIPSAP
jgi:hypothetical protein